MTNFGLKNQIIKWLKEQDYWIQYAGNKILEVDVITPEFAASCYDVFLENWKLKKADVKRQPIVFNSSPEEEALSTVPPPRLTLISEILNVNALATKQAIEIGPNLTVIYGNNGAGKSGYTRLLNKAFNGRGDKLILPNVFSTMTAGSPSCKFTFHSLPLEVKFPEEKGRLEFSCFSIFDSSCVRIHLENDNRLNFTPSGFDFFDKLLILYENLKQKLGSEISKNQPGNNFITLFENQGLYKQAVESLCATTKEADLKKLGNYTEVDSNDLAALISKREELKKLDIPKKIAGLQILSEQLKRFRETWIQIYLCLNNEGINNCQETINSFETFSELAISESGKSFEGWDIEQVGSLKWREFIKAAHNYALFIKAKALSEAEYPSTDDQCLFCLQPLPEEEKNLIKAYWVFLKGEATVELGKAVKILDELEKKMKSIKIDKFDNANTLFTYVEGINAGLAQKWQSLINEAENNRKNVIKNLAAKKWDISVAPLINQADELDSIEGVINSSIVDLISKNPLNEISQLDIEIQLNKDKLLFSKLLDGILKYTASHLWAQNGTTVSKNAFRTNSLTDIQKKLFNEHISDAYTNLFKEECKKLNAPEFVQIAQKNAKATSTRSLQVKGQWANRVLSEGEQKVISLADFFTESQLNPINVGMIFDDPVNSLDHVRKKIIAKRLVELSVSKQVIIFTHDLNFVSQLKEFAEPSKTGFICHWIENDNGSPGQIYNNNSPATETEYKTTNRAIKSLADAKIASPETREGILKEGFASLRSNYEYLIIHNLFASVVLRFGERISPDKLKKVIVTPEFAGKIADKVGLLSRYIEAHLHSDEYIDIKPTSDDLAREINEFSEIQKELKALRKPLEKEAA